MSYLPVQKNEPRKKISRRDFLRYGIFGGAFAVLAESLGSFLVFFWPLRTAGFGGKVVAGKVENFPKGADPVVNIEGKFFLVHNEDGLLALYRRCTHLGCIVPPWEKENNRFNCVCHGSLFNKEGEVTGGPAPRPLDLFPIEIVGDRVIVATGEPIERTRYDPSQAVRV